jgi:hypothetical protein
VKSSRSPSTPAPEKAPAAGPAGGFFQGWTRFWFSPVDPVGLHGLRFLAGLLFLAWLLPAAGNVENYFGPQGWFDKEAAAEASRLPDSPPQLQSWSILELAGSDSRALRAVYWSSIGVLALFTLGIFPRVTAVLTWAVVTSFTANPALDLDAYALFHILALYLMVGYLLLGRNGRRVPGVGANVALRLLQVHLAVVFVTSGLHKLQFGEWWAGVALWYPLHPPFQTTPASARLHASDAEFYLGMLSVAAYLAMAWQLGFPFFAWRRRWRPVLVGGALVGWLATALLFRLPLLGPALFIASLSYLLPDEWRWLISWPARLVPRWRTAAGPAVQPKAPTAVSRSEGIATVASVGHN